MFAHRSHLHRLRPAFVITVLAVAFALRLSIVVKGGAFYWTDEKRFNATREAVAAATVGDWDGVKKELLSGSDHIGFRWLSLPPAIAERLLYADNPPNAKLCAAWFSIFSVANLILIWLIARRSGTRSGEAEWALVFAATSNALFYFSRHCVPYDAALTFFLAATFVSANPNPRRRPLVVGILCGLGYLVYNGYWSVGAVVCLLDLALQSNGFVARLRTAARLVAGVFIPVLVVFATSAAAGYNLVADSLHFAGSVNQGDFGDGWRFIPEYLWAADGLAVVILGALVLAGAVVNLATGRRERWLLWIAEVVVLIATWLAFSDVFRKFVLYGRTVRALEPFLALGAAGALLFLRERLPRRLAALPIVVAVIGCLAGLYMMRTPLQQLFPREFRPMAERETARVHVSNPEAVLQSVYDDYMAGPEPAEVPPGRVLLRAAHPHQYRPYLFEGYTREQRPRYLAGDRSMRLIEVDPTAVATNVGAEPLFGGNLGPIELVLQFPTDAPGRSQVLVSTGTTGAGDQLYVIYEDAGHVRFGLDHWGGAPLVSDAIAVRPDAEHRVTFSIGSLFPSLDDPEYRRSPEACFLKRWLHLALDGTAVFSRAFDSYPARKDSVHFGRSVIGGSNADPVFTGKLIAVHHRTPRSLGLVERSVAWPAANSLPAEGHVGAIRLTIELPKPWTPGKEALLTTGTPPNLDVVFLRYVGPNHLSIGYRHGRDRERQSEAVVVEQGTVHQIELSLPSLTGIPSDTGVVLLDGTPVLRMTGPSFEASPDSVHLGFAPDRLEGMRSRFSGKLIRIEPARSTP